MIFSILNIDIEETIHLLYFYITILRILLYIKKMKRKTNLFYTTGTDSNFITFSNYAESMTGNHLSTDTKLFPSAFICAYIDGLGDDKDSFIKEIAAKYENKLAFLRDKCIENNVSVEEKLKPLPWLIEDLISYVNTHGEEVNIDFNYIGQITEQDYNGTFSDMICTIDSSTKQNAVIVTKSISTEDMEQYDENTSYLYGWAYEKTDKSGYIYVGPTEYQKTTPIFDILNDTGAFYNYDTSIVQINIENQPTEEIKFNILIPLYDVVNTNYKTNTTIISESSVIDFTNAYTRFVPYGIWFSGDNPVILPRHEYAPSWSLTLSSQFKPFPYSKSAVDEISDSSKSAAYQTFSQILARQNTILDSLQNVSNQIMSLNNRVSNLEANIKSFGTSYNIDGIHLEVLELQKQIDKLNK